MENKIYYVNLVTEDSDYMIFNISNFKYKINLNNNEKNDLTKLFYAIIKLTFNEKPTFQLSNELGNFTNMLLIEVATEYLKDLNKEIEEIIKLQPDLNE